MEENCILTNFVINFKGDDVTRYELLFSIDLVPCQKIWPLCEAGTASLADGTQVLYFSGAQLWRAVKLELNCIIKKISKRKFLHCYPLLLNEFN